VRVLVVYGHPVPGSFNSAVLARVRAGLERAGHEIDVVDLHAVDFDPVLPAEEWQVEYDPVDSDPILSDHIARLLRADALVFVHPTWWGGQPAVVKGWIDRVFANGAAYDRMPARNRVRGRLGNIRRLAVVATHGSSKMVNLVQGEPGKLTVLRQLRLLCHRRCRKQWLAFYSGDRAGDEQRRAFLIKVEDAFARW
jgi:putative NADPH-quinone reductase